MFSSSSVLTIVPQLGRFERIFCIKTFVNHARAPSAGLRPGPDLSPTFPSTRVTKTISFKNKLSCNRIKIKQLVLLILVFLPVSEYTLCTRAALVNLDFCYALFVHRPTALVLTRPLADADIIQTYADPVFDRRSPRHN